MKILMVVPLFLFSQIAIGTNYYVKNAGNDSNTGLSDAQAWAHHPWMSTWTGRVNLAPGDTIFMKRGDKWSIANPDTPYMTVGQSGMINKPITTTTYGTGDQPIINISTDSNFPVIQGLGKSFITFDNLEISHFDKARDVENGQDGIRFGKDGSLNVPHDWIITDCTIHEIPSIGILGMNDSYNITIGNSSVTSCATPDAYSNNIYNCGYAGIILKGRDPVTDRSNWNIYYNYIHNIDFTDRVSRDSYGIALTMNTYGNGEYNSDGWPAFCFTKFNRVENIPTWNGIDSHGGSYLYIQDNYVFNCSAGICLMAADRVWGATPILDNCYIERNIIENSGEITIGKTNFILCLAENELHMASNCQINYNSCFYTTKQLSSIDGTGIEILNIDRITLKGNKIYNGIPDKIAIHLPMSGKLKNVTICNNWISNWGYGSLIAMSRLDGYINLNNNVFYTDYQGILASTNSFNGEFTIHNNTFFINPASAQPYILALRPTVFPDGSSLSIKNNIMGFTTTTTEGIYIMTPGTMIGSIDIDNNLYLNSTRYASLYLNREGYNFIQWLTTGFDTHSLNSTDPLFLNESGSYELDTDFKLQSKSPAIDKGGDVGLTTDYAGNSISGLPDIGAFEYQNIQAPVPGLVSSVIENSSPSELDLTFDLTLANIVPASSAFTIIVNSSARDVSSVAISGTKVTLSLSNSAAYGDVVTVAYTKPAANPLQTAAGGQATSISAQTVTNKIAAPAVPVFSSAAIENANPSILEMTYNLSLANSVPAASAFTVTVNSVARTVSSVTISGTKVLLTLASPVAYSNVVTVSYTKPSSTSLQTTAGGQAASISAQPVSNRIAAPAPVVPVFSGSAIDNATPSRLEITYSLSLANTIPAASAFTVIVNSAARTVSSVTISGVKVLLTLASPVAYGNFVTVSYTKPSSNPLQTTAGGQAASISAQPVSNGITAPAPAVPVFSGAVIENATPSRLEITYSLSLTNIIPATSAFTVIVNSATQTVSSVTISGVKVLLTLASPVAYGNVVTISYTKPSSNPLQTTAGGQAASISAQPVSNRIAALAPAVPVFSGAAIENATPSRLELTFSLSLANIIPAASTFLIVINSEARSVSSVAISGTKVLLTLVSPVDYGEKVTVSYTKPSVNPLQTTSGGQASSITAQPVMNNVTLGNEVPVLVVKSPQTSFSGFVNEISVEGSYDANKDNLTFTWSAPASVPISSTSGSLIKFLGPIVSEITTLEFKVTASDGKTTVSKIIPVEILPYKPELEMAEVISVQASGFYSVNYPYNIIDGNIGTMWSADGIDQWLVIEMKEVFSISHVKLAFQPGQRRESYFDVYGLIDKETTWEPILNKTASCSFSGNPQVFDFPPSKTGKEFKYIKLEGKGNSTDTWNYISELRIFGNRHRNPSFYDNLEVKVFPNPANDLLNIKIDEPTLSPDFIRIINLTGKVVFQDIVSPNIKEFQIPIKLQNGIYILQLGSGYLTLFTQKLVVANK